MNNCPCYPYCKSGTHLTNMRCFAIFVFCAFSHLFIYFANKPVCMCVFVKSKCVNQLHWGTALYGQYYCDCWKCSFPPNWTEHTIMALALCSVMSKLVNPSIKGCVSIFLSVKWMNGWTLGEILIALVLVTWWWWTSRCSSWNIQEKVAICFCFF